MKRKIGLGIFLIWLLSMSYGLIVSQYDYSPIQITDQVTKKSLPKYYDYKGVTHAVTKRTKGSGSIEEVFTAAKSADIDFIFITDPNFFPEEEQQDLYSNGTRLFMGTKLSYVDSHILVFGGLDLHKFKSIGQSQIQLNDLLTQKHRSPENMSLVLAHPKRPKYEWSGEIPIGLNGIEVINLKQIWAQKAREQKAHFLLSLFLYPFNETLSFLNIISEPREELRLWDDLNKKQKMTGFFGNHTTAKAIIFPTDNGYIKFPSYQTSFNIGSNHILLSSELTGMIQRDKQKILEALKRGQFYFAFDIVANPKGFYAELLSDGEELPIGSEVKFKEGMSLKVNLPFEPKVPFEIKLVKDGNFYTTSNQEKVEFKINGPGTYRVEVLLKSKMPLLQSARWVPWIYTNAFYIK